jgi:hypothetical protein
MKYYSDVLHTLFDTQDALEEAEAKKTAADAEKVHAKETARKRREEDKERFLELRKKFNKISTEYDKTSKEYMDYADKMMQEYSLDAVLDWLSDAFLYDCATAKTKADASSTTTATTKTAREPENLGEILARIFEDMR